MNPIPSTPDFRRLFEAVPGLYLVLDPVLCIVAVSDAYARATLTRRAEIVGRHLFDVFPDNPDDPLADGVRNLNASLQRVLAGRVADAMPVQKYDVRRADGSGGGFEERHWKPLNTPVLDDRGEVAWIIHHVEDVTEFVRVQRQRGEQERLAETLRERTVQLEAEVRARRDAEEILLVSRVAALNMMEDAVEAQTLAERANAGLQREVTERRQAEERLAEERNLLRTLIDHQPDYIYLKDSESRFLLVNRASLELMGLESAEDVVGKTVADFFPAELAAGYAADDRAVLDSGTPIFEREELIVGQDGAHRWLLTTKVPLRDHAGEIFGLVGISRDITERRRAEEARIRLAAIVNSSDDAIISKTLDGIITSWNPGAEKLFGYPADEAVGQPMVMLFPPERRQEEAEILGRVRQGCSLSHFHTLRVRKDGECIDVAVTVSPITDGAGKVVGVSTIARDITERKQAEDRVREQLARVELLNRVTRAIGERQDLQSIFQVAVRRLEDDLPVDFCCVCFFDAAAHTVNVTTVGVASEALALELAMTEHSRVPIDENGLSRCVRGQLVYEPDIAAVDFPFPRRLARGGLRALVVAPLLVESKVFGVLVAARRRPDSFSSGECEFLRQLSEQVALAAHQAQLHAALQQAYDDLRRTQQVAAQQERLRALGQMASGIAHDINNALSPVALYTESLLQNEPGLSARAREQLQITARAIDDVSATVARMREFYRPREAQAALAPTQLNGLVWQVLDLTQARWSDMALQRGSTIAVTTELAADLPAVAGVEGELREALTNLIFNAVDAMPTGGTMTLRTRVVAGPGDGHPGGARRVELEVSDTGVGMDEATRRRCLEPFFTTKGERGTGLGLAMVYGTAQRHGAEVEIESTPGRGTTVRLVFPENAGPAAGVARNEGAAHVPGPLRILLVDDDPLLLRSLRETLEVDGHAVTIANGGREGVDAFRAAHRSGQPFAVVITDLGMPHADGRVVAAAIKETSPGTPVILLTGWGQRLVAEGDVPPHVDQVLSKPPKLHLVRQALARCCPPGGN